MSQSTMFLLKDVILITTEENDKLRQVEHLLRRYFVRKFTSTLKGKMFLSVQIAVKYFLY